MKQLWSLAQEHSEDIKQPGAGVDYLVYYILYSCHSTSASLKRRQTIFSEVQTHL